MQRAAYLLRECRGGYFRGVDVSRGLKLRGAEARCAVGVDVSRGLKLRGAEARCAVGVDVSRGLKLRGAEARCGGVKRSLDMSRQAHEIELSHFEL